MNPASVNPYDYVGEPEVEEMIRAIRKAPTTPNMWRYRRGEYLSTAYELSYPLIFPTADAAILALEVCLET